MVRLKIPVLTFLFFMATTGFCRAEMIIDQAGRKIEVTRPFARIISLYPAHTENLVTLGLDQEIIGIASGDDYPPQVLSRQRYSYQEDPEKFIAARPDLVLVRPMIERSYPQLIEKLEKAGIVVVSLQPNDVDEIIAYWRDLGTLTGRKENAETMIRTFQKELAQVKDLVRTVPVEKRKRVYFEAIHEKMKTFAAQSIAMFALELAGGINVAADADQVSTTNIAAYGKERIMAKAAEIDVYLAQQGRMNPVDRAAILSEPGFGVIKAIKDEEVYLIDESVVSRPTLRILEGVRTITDILYPGLRKSDRKVGRDAS